MKNLWILLFFVRVLIPTQARTYDNVKEVSTSSDGWTHLILTNGKQVMVPTIWTIIEEK